MSIVLASNKLQGIKNDPQPGQGFANLPVGGRQLFQGFGPKQFRALRPVKGEAIQSCGIVLGAAHPEELPFPVLVRILEEGEEDPARDPGKAYPEAFPLLFHLKEMQEDIYRRGDTQVSAKNLKPPHECPTVGMELGGAILISVRSSRSKGVNERRTPTRLNTVWYMKNRFSRPAGTDGYVGIVCAAEGVQVVQVGVPTMSFQVLEGSQAGAFAQELVGGPWVEGFVVGLGGRGGGIRLRVRARHGVNK